MEEPEMNWGSSQDYQSLADFSNAPIPTMAGNEIALESQVDPEEQERQRLQDEKHQQLMKKLMEKEDKERLKIEAKKQEAKTTLQKWYEDRNREIQQRKHLNQENEKLYSDSMQKYEQENPWMKVATLVDFKEANDRKDIGRMRSVLLAKKHEG